jgi:thiosulfate reductase cytochrome b subunit
MRLRPEQPALIRITHWLSAFALFAMAASGLQIWVAYPYLGPRGAPYGWFPLQGFEPPEWLRAGAWLAGARHVHFAFAWPLLVSGAAYIAFATASGEWRRRVFVPRRDARNAVETALHYAGLREASPASGLYNGLQRAAYTIAVALVALQVLSGLAIWKPLQLAPLAALFGGYDGARTTHFLVLVALTAFVIGHVVMVAAHPRTLVTMITGGRRGPKDLS